MAEKIVVDGKIVDDVGQKPDENQTLLNQETRAITPPEVPKKEDFESEEEFTAALKQHKVDNQEPWQKTDEETTDEVPVGTHIKMKQKLKGRILERDDTISNLEAKITSLEQTRIKPESPGIPLRPIENDFKTDVEYHEAVTKWEDDRLQTRFEKNESSKLQKETVKQFKKNLDKSVDSHYERAGKLIDDSGISSEVFKKADEIVRHTIESIRPKQGDLITDQMISLLSEGSEKVMFFLGRNKTALAEVKGLLAEDSSGMKAAIYLGQQKERLTNPKRKTSQAPPPANKASGDDVPNAKSGAFKKKYDKAHKEGNSQAAYNAKKKARVAGVDVSSW